MAILTAEIKEFIIRQKLGFVATVNADGTPHLSPKGTTTVWDDEHLAFADIHSPGTVRNLMTNPAVEVNIVDIFKRKGYRFKGFGRVYSEGSVFEAVLSFYRSAGSKHAIKNIVLIRVEDVYPLTSPAYDTGISEDEVIKRWKDYWSSIY